MKDLYDVLVKANNTALVEALLSRLEISQTDWSRSNVFELQGESVVLYTIKCDSDTYETIINTVE